MRKTGNAQGRPYHHGDLRRALIAAARQIVEEEGTAALSLRAVAREAGVSAAAPYHHFKDKAELMDALADRGWWALDGIIADARAKARDAKQAIIDIGVAYVAFAQRNPRLYRLMYETSRKRTDLPEQAKGDGGSYDHLRCALIEAGADRSDQLDLQLCTIAAWCAAHGLAELASFKQFDALKTQMGGEEDFVRGVIEHIHIYRRHLQPVT
jgi:AcrR family transcriptional regulator